MCGTKGSIANVRKSSYGKKRKLPRAELWWAAVKVPMYTVAVTPVLVGTAAGYFETRVLSLTPCLQFLFAAILIIAWLNLCNDVFDHATGIDINKAESVVNLLGGSTHARHNVLFLAHALLIIAFLLLRAMCIADWTPLYLIAAAVAGGYAYQGPPFRLGYFGLGEPICFFAWTLAVTAAFHVQLLAAGKAAPNITTAMQHLYDPASALPAAALLVALPTTLILLCSHFHQVVDDAAAGKRSPVVRLGTARAAVVVQFCAALFLGLHVLLVGVGLMPWQAAFMGIVAATPSVKILSSFVGKHHGNPRVVRVLKYIAVKMHFLHGVALTAGYAVAAVQGK